MWAQLHLNNKDSAEAEAKTKAKAPVNLVQPLPEQAAADVGALSDLMAISPDNVEILYIQSSTDQSRHQLTHKQAELSDVFVVAIDAPGRDGHDAVHPLQFTGMSLLSTTLLATTLLPTTLLPTTLFALRL
jgi:hypothetical protein